MPEGTPVDVHYCRSGWCEASSFLGTGWVSSYYLESDRPYRPYRSYHPYRRAYPYRVYPGPPPPVMPPPYPYDDYRGSGFGFYFGVP